MKGQPNWKNQKGRRFQKLVSEFLSQQSYSVEEEFRDAGTEIDAVCKNKLTGGTLIVEFKARAETVKAETINKLHTDVEIYDAKQGWIFSISDIGAEASTRLQKLNAKISAVRYRYFSPSQLVSALVEAGFIKLPEAQPDHSSSELFLCLFEHQTLWVSPQLDPRSGRPYAISGWDSRSGNKLADTQLPDITATDFRFNGLPWTTAETNEAPSKTDRQPVVEVIPGEEWSDYRPSRPDDFVGRAHVLDSVSRFLDRIRANQTRSRLFGIKGKSGWGKSSLALRAQPKIKVSDFSGL